MNIRTNKKYASDISLQEIIGVDREGNEVRIEDKISDLSESVDEQVGLKMQIKTLYDKMGKVLKGRESDVICLRYGLTKTGMEKTQREIGEMLGISRSYVSRIEQKALRKLYKEMSQ